jgi:hypothetical protein
MARRFGRIHRNTLPVKTIFRELVALFFVIGQDLSAMDHKYIEVFLESAFESLEQLSATVGRVTVEANYDAIPDDSDIVGLADELRRCAQREVARSVNLDSPQGHVISPSTDYPLLKKYLTIITLYKATLMGSWVQVIPFGGAYRS